MFSPSIAPEPPTGDNSHRIATTKWVTSNVTGATGPTGATGATGPTAVQGHGSTVAVGGAATLNSGSGVVTSEGLTSATSYTLTLTNSVILATSTVLVTAWSSTGASIPINIGSVTPSLHQVVIAVGMTSLTGTIIFAFAVFN